MLSLIRCERAMLLLVHEGSQSTFSRVFDLGMGSVSNLVRLVFWDVSRKTDKADDKYIKCLVRLTSHVSNSLVSRNEKQTLLSSERGAQNSRLLDKYLYLLFALLDLTQPLISVIFDL